ncbi:MAG: hypothetical protein IT443_10500 [Phycisphaeraceae bacterium]|nr:hypothetical protein [Phycisphaeraceae bacterium]
MILLVNTRGLESDGIMPIGMIEAANLLKQPKKGIYYFELTPEVLKDAQAVVFHVHWDWNYFYLRQMVQMVRQTGRRIPVIVGGYLSQTFGEYLVNEVGVDYALLGDYEMPFMQLIEAVCAGRDEAWIGEHVPNIRSRAGISQGRYKVTAPTLAELDGLTLDWFAGLSEYLQFQDALASLGSWRFAENHYFPSIILKSCFNRMCRYCLLSNRSATGWCAEDHFALLSERDFVRTLEKCQGRFACVNVFANFSALNLPRLLELLEGKRFDFELSINDAQERMAAEDVLALGAHFRKLVVMFYVLPAECYVGQQPITMDLLDADADMRLLSFLAGQDHVEAKFWFNSRNLMATADRGAAIMGLYRHSMQMMNSWLPWPNLSNNQSFYRQLEQREAAYRLANQTRAISIYVEEGSARPGPQSMTGIHVDPFTVMRSGPDSQARTGQLLGSLAPNEIGVFGTTVDLGDRAAGGACRILVEDQKVEPEGKRLQVRYRRFEVHGIGEGWRLKLMAGDNVYRLELMDSGGQVKRRAYLNFTIRDFADIAKLDKTGEFKRIMTPEVRRLITDRAQGRMGLTS